MQKTRKGINSQLARLSVKQSKQDNLWPICTKPVVSMKIKFQDIEQKPYEGHFLQIDALL